MKQFRKSTPLHSGLLEQEQEKEMEKNNNDPPVLWVGVEVYGLLVQGAHLFTTGKEADDWFETYTEGLTPETLYDENGCVNPDYDQTKIFIVRRSQVIEIVKELLQNKEISEAGEESAT